MLYTVLLVLWKLLQNDLLGDLTKMVFLNLVLVFFSFFWLLKIFGNSSF